MTCCPAQWDDLCIAQGATFYFSINYKNLDLSAYTAAVFEVVDTLGGTVILSASLAGGTIALYDGSDLTTYNIQITIPAATTNTANFALTTNGYWKVDITDGSGIVTRALQGRVKLQKDTS